VLFYVEFILEAMKENISRKEKEVRREMQQIEKKKKGLQMLSLSGKTIGQYLRFCVLITTENLSKRKENRFSLSTTKR